MADNNMSMRAAATGADLSAGGERAAGGTAMGRGPVLVIDDEDDAREAMQILLNGEGYECEDAVNGREAVQKIEGGLRPCVMVLDLMMPVMDGVAFRRWQLDNPAVAHVPVIACSGMGSLDTAVEGLQFNAVVAKPDLYGRVVTWVRIFCAARGDSTPRSQKE